MNSDLFPVVFEDADWLVVHKPADLVCHPTKGDARSSLIGRMRLYLGPASPVAIRSRGTSCTGATNRRTWPWSKGG